MSALPISRCAFGHQYVSISSPHLPKRKYVYYCPRCEVGYVMIGKPRQRKRKHLDRQEVMRLIAGAQVISFGADG